MRYNFIIKGTTNKTWGLQKQKWQWRLETFPDVIDGTFSYKVGHLSYLTLAIHNESSHVLSDTFCIAILVVLAARTIKTVEKRENSQAIKITLAWFNRCSDQNTVFFNKKKMQFNLLLSVVCAALCLFLAWERGTAESRGWTGVCLAADPTSSRLEWVFPDTEFCLNRGSCKARAKHENYPPFQTKAFIGTTRKCIVLFSAVLGILNNLFTYQRESSYFWDPYLNIGSGIKES